MKILFSMLKWILLANPGWLEKLLIISWNCWVKIMNEMETLNTLCAPIAYTLFEIVAITNYALLWNAAYFDQYELQHFAEESQHVVSHCVHLSGRSMNWKEQENFALPFAAESQPPSENISEQFDFYWNVHFICFTKKAE